MAELRQTDLFRKWEAGLGDRRARALIATRLFRLANGIEGDIVSLGDGVFELRIHYGPGYRIYFHRRGREIIVLLAGGHKGTQERDIRTAKRIAKDWNGNG